MGNAPRIDLPDLIDKLGQLGDRKKAIEDEERPIRQQILLHFKSAGIKNSESASGAYLCTRVADDDEKPDWSKKALIAVYGEAWAVETEEALIASKLVTHRAEFIRVMARKPKADSAVEDAKSRDLDAETKTFFGKKAAGG